MMSTMAVMFAQTAPGFVRCRGFYRIGEPLVMPCQTQGMQVKRWQRNRCNSAAPSPDPRLARQGGARPRAQSASGHELRRALHLSRIHRDVPGHRPAGFRHAGHRLRAEGLARRIEIAEALSQQLPQSRRVPRGLHGRDRQETGRAAEAEMAAHRRLFPSARRHADRRVLAGGKVAVRRLGARSGRQRPIARADSPCSVATSALDLARRIGGAHDAAHHRDAGAARGDDFADARRIDAADGEHRHAAARAISASPLRPISGP